MRGLVGGAAGGSAVAQMCGKLFGGELRWGAIHLAGLLSSCIEDLCGGTVCVGAVFGGAVVGSSGGRDLETLYP